MKLKEYYIEAKMKGWEKGPYLFWRLKVNHRLNKVYDTRFRWYSAEEVITFFTT